MYWPNEAAHTFPAFTQAGGRSAFTAMEANGKIDALQIYSYRVERAKFLDEADFEQAATQAIHAFAPDILFVQHVWGTAISEEFWIRLRVEMPNLTITYHEGDAFGRLIKRLDRATSMALRHAHLILSCGGGSLARLLSEHGSAPVGYMPHCFVASHFARHDPAGAAKRDEIVMIGSNGRLRKLPIFYMPGGRRRAQLARRLSDGFGASFALYGHGWSHLASARGAVPFFQQEAAIQSGRISANWDHFDTVASYFSDRLPISLAAGVPHVTSWHEGYDEVLGGCPGLYPCKSLDEAVDTCRLLLGKSDSKLLDEGLAAREWAFSHLEANVVFKNGLDQAIAVHHKRHSG